MKTKVCSKCNQVKILKKDFYRKNKTRMQAYCKECFNLYCMAPWRARKAQFVKELGDICVDCQASYPPAVYDFHHLGDKEFDWERLRLYSIERIRKELGKCVLLCSNCHRLRHSDQTFRVVSSAGFGPAA